MATHRSSSRDSRPLTVSSYSVVGRRGYESLNFLVMSFVSSVISTQSLSCRKRGFRCLISAN